MEKNSLIKKLFTNNAFFIHINILFKYNFYFLLSFFNISPPQEFEPFLTFAFIVFSFSTIALGSGISLFFYFLEIFNVLRKILDECDQEETNKKLINPQLTENEHYQEGHVLGSSESLVCFFSSFFFPLTSFIYFKIF